MVTDESKGITNFCILLIIIYICTLLVELWHIPLAIFSSAYKEYFIKVFGEGTYAMNRLFEPLGTIIIFAIILGATQSLKLKPKGRKLLILSSATYVVYHFVANISFFFVATDYWKFITSVSANGLPQPTFVLSLFTIYYFTRPKVKEQFK